MSCFSLPEKSKRGEWERTALAKGDENYSGLGEILFRK